MVVVTTRNYHVKTLRDLHVSVSLPGFSERQVKLVRNLKSGEGEARIFELEMPEDFDSNYEFLRIAVSNDKYKRIIYRELRLV